MGEAGFAAQPTIAHGELPGTFLTLCEIHYLCAFASLRSFPPPEQPDLCGRSTTFASLRPCVFAFSSSKQPDLYQSFRPNKSPPWLGPVPPRSGPWNFLTALSRLTISGSTSSLTSDCDAPGLACVALSDKPIR